MYVTCFSSYVSFFFTQYGTSKSLLNHSCCNWGKGVSTSHNANTWHQEQVCLVKYSSWQKLSTAYNTVCIVWKRFGNHRLMRTQPASGRVNGKGGWMVKTAVMNWQLITGRYLCAICEIFSKNRIYILSYDRAWLTVVYVFVCVSPTNQLVWQKSRNTSWWKQHRPLRVTKQNTANHTHTLHKDICLAGASQ